ncbi:hypothetical protein HDU96_010887 [Phlyctochytrium bullatum]|nr:hypothetical protein HDU96_010887 [Phlyctochytrium bullatum]
MPSLIELVPVELARRITTYLYFECFLNLLATSKVLRRLFAPYETDLQFLRRHLQPLFEEATSMCKSSEVFHEVIELASVVPFRRLPKVYAVAWLAECWDVADAADSELQLQKAMACVVVAFPDLEINQKGELQFRHGPHRPIAWMEKVIVKALEINCLRIALLYERTLVFNLATLFDSVMIVHMALERRFPEEMKFERGAPGSSTVVESVKVCLTFCPRNSFFMRVDDDVQDSLAGRMALVAFDAASNGAIHVLDYALQHPLAPIAFNFRCCYHQLDRNPPRNIAVSLAGIASSRAHMHVLDYLLGNSLPLAPPPASHPIRPGISPGSAGTNHGALEASGKDNVKLSHQNPVAILDQPLQSLLSCSFRGHDFDPVPAVIYLLDHGAPAQPASIRNDSVHCNFAQTSRASPVAGRARGQR